MKRRVSRTVRVLAVVAGGLQPWLRGRGVSFTPLTDFNALASEL